jgi:hypothetical protein
MSPLADSDDAEDIRNYQLNIEEGTIEMPEQPEPLMVLRKLRRFNLTLWPGGYADQPAIHMMEMNAVIDVEIEQENIHVLNAIYKAQAKARLEKDKQDA